MLLTTRTLPSQRIIEHLEHEAQHLKGCTEEKQAQDAIFLTWEPQTKPKYQQKIHVWTVDTQITWSLNVTGLACPCTKQSRRTKRKKKEERRQSTCSWGWQESKWDGLIITQHCSHIPTEDQLNLHQTCKSQCDIQWLWLFDGGKNQPTETHKLQYHMDSGAMSHCTLHHEDFVEFTTSNCKQFVVWTVHPLQLFGIGKIKLHLGKSRWLTLHDTLFSPQATLCLISIGCLADQGLTCMFVKGGCAVCKLCWKNASRRRTEGKWFVHTQRKTTPSRIWSICPCFPFATHLHKWLGPYWVQCHDRHGQA